MISQAGTTGPTQTCAVPGPSAQLPTDDMPAADTDDMPAVVAHWHICTSPGYHPSWPEPHVAEKSQLASPPRPGQRARLPPGCRQPRRVVRALHHRCPAGSDHVSDRRRRIERRRRVEHWQSVEHQRPGVLESACSHDTAPERRRWNLHVSGPSLLSCLRRCRRRRRCRCTPDRCSEPRRRLCDPRRTLFHGRRAGRHPSRRGGQNGRPHGPPRPHRQLRLPTGLADRGGTGPVETRRARRLRVPDRHVEWTGPGCSRVGASGFVP